MAAINMVAVKAAIASLVSGSAPNWIESARLVLRAARTLPHARAVSALSFNNGGLRNTVTEPYVLQYDLNRVIVEISEIAQYMHRRPTIVIYRIFYDDDNDDEPLVCLRVQLRITAVLRSKKKREKASRRRMPQLRPSATAATYVSAGSVVLYSNVDEFKPGDVPKFS